MFRAVQVYYIVYDNQKLGPNYIMGKNMLMYLYYEYHVAV